jgi:tetratricopeptide (TPR) repeat protein
MSAGRSLSGVAILALLGVYGYRTVTGFLAGTAFERGHVLYNAGTYGYALPELDRSRAGALTMRAVRMAAQARMDKWEFDVRYKGHTGADRDLLSQAAELFLECRCIAPASATSWDGLAHVYDSLEWIGRERRALAPLQPAASPWDRVGRNGRVALGMMRGALHRWPNWFRFHDRYAIALWRYGLEDRAREAVAEAARALPVYVRHRFAWEPGLPPWFAEDFAIASRGALGQLQVLPRTVHWIDLGKLERRLGAHDRAIEALTEALERGGDALNRAEASFHLGLALIDAGRPAEGRPHLQAAAEHPAFRGEALLSLAGISERSGELAEALEHLRELRWERPQSLEPCLDFARVSRELGDWRAAEEALLWARLTHPDDTRPYVALVEGYIAEGDLAAARSIVRELEVVPDSSPAVARLEKLIAEAAQARTGEDASSG